MPRPIVLGSGVYHLNIRVPRDLADRPKWTSVILPIERQHITVRVGDKVIVSLWTRDPGSDKRPGIAMTRLAEAEQALSHLNGGVNERSDMNHSARRGSDRLTASAVCAGLLLIGGPATAATDAYPTLAALVAGHQRSPANVARDPYRHPLETLVFLYVKPDATVVEILPGGAGYWTEILAPYLRDHGRYIAANPPGSDTSEEAVKGKAAFARALAADPTDFGKVAVTAFAPPTDLGPAGSADAVLTFRNVHNWMAAGTADAVFSAFFRVLKPGGTLGIEEHRGRLDQPQDPQAKSGYVREDAVVGLAEHAGFRLAARSEIDANPKDTKDYPAGVWTLPPTFRLKDKDRDRYAAIGESDRMLLMFVKPAP